MRILIGVSTYQDIENPKMGSERQALGTAKALGELGHEVYVTNILMDAPRWEKGYDVIHLFNASGKKGPYLHVMEMAHVLGKPVFLTPVYWPLAELLYEVSKYRNYSAKDHDEVFKAFREDIHGVRACVQRADWLLPNAELEMATLLGLSDLSMELDRPPLSQTYTVVPNAVDVQNEILPTLSEDRPLPHELKARLSDRFILCVARAELRKNQHRLVEAMETIWKDDPSLQLVLLGALNHDYVRSIEPKIKGKNIIIVQQSAAHDVLNLMKRATCSVLPSLLETPGLVNLEAAALGVPVVASSRGSVKEYLGDGGHYCDPLDPESIADAIKEAIAAGPNLELQRHVQESFSYERVAELTDAAYRRLLDGDDE